MKIIAFVIIGVLLIRFSYSQENYIKGYLIKNNRDTLSGFIDYRNWEINPDVVKYKNNINDTPITFTPTDIIEFHVQNEIYAGGIINTEVSKRKTNELGQDPQLQLKVDTTFLQLLFRGKKSLFYYKIGEGIENFYIQQDSVFELLIYKKYLKLLENNTVAVENKKFLGQLTLYLNDCPTIQSKLKSTKYELKSLIKLFEVYYKCTQSVITYRKEVEKTVAEFGVIIGGSLSGLKFSGAEFEYLTNADFNHSINFSAGLFFDFILSRNQGKWSINNELLFSSYKVESQYQEYIHESFYTNYTMEFGYSYIKLNNLLRFKVPINKVFLYFNAGISNGIAINEINKSSIEITYFSQTRLVEEEALKYSRLYEQGYILGIGSKYKKYSFEIRFEKGNGMSEYAQLASSTTRYFVLLGYKF